MSFQHVDKNFRYTDKDPEIEILYRLNEYYDAQITERNDFVNSCDKIITDGLELTGKQINCLIDIYQKLLDDGKIRGDNLEY